MAKRAKKNVGCLVNHLLDCMLTLVQGSPRSTESEKQATSKAVGAENDGTSLHKSPGQNDAIVSEEQPTGKDVGAENDGTGYDGKSTVKSTLDPRLTLIFFRALPGTHPSRKAVPKKNKGWQILPRTSGGEAHS